MVGPSIKNFRKKKKVTQGDLAKWLGVSRQAVSMWEADKRELKATTLNKIAKMFGVSVDEILRTTHVSETKEEEMARSAKSKRKLGKVHFQLNAPQAKKVALTGDFKSWSQSGISMRKNRSGLWKVGVDLKPGRYEYKFIVDNEWWADPGNQNISSNSFGTANSVVEIGA